jgi:hypothetical protein
MVAGGGRLDTPFGASFYAFKAIKVVSRIFTQWLKTRKGYYYYGCGQRAFVPTPFSE